MMMIAPSKTLQKEIYHLNLRANIHISIYVYDDALACYIHVLNVLSFFSFQSRVFLFAFQTDIGEVKVYAHTHIHIHRVCVYDVCVFTIATSYVATFPPFQLS